VFGRAKWNLGFKVAVSLFSPLQLSYLFGCIWCEQIITSARRPPLIRYMVYHITAMHVNKRVHA